MEDVSIRLLRAEEIECRIAMINEKGLSLLLFKDARVDQKLLDETFTPFGWKRSHQVIDGNLYCTVEVWDREKNQWIGKQDVGTMSYTEKEKGQASDSFKRACFNWGIGRELYTAPFIWIPAERVNIQKKEREQKFYTYDRFHVWSINYDEEGKINAVMIVNQKNEIVYSMDARILNMDTKEAGEKQATGKMVKRAENKVESKTEQGRTRKDEGKTDVKAEQRIGNKVEENVKDKAKQETANKADKKAIRGRDAAQKEGKETSGDEESLGATPALTKRQRTVLESELERTGVALDAVLNRYHLESAEQISEEIYKKAIECLKKSKSKEAA